MPFSQLTQLGMLSISLWSVLVLLPLASRPAEAIFAGGAEPVEANSRSRRHSKSGSVSSGDQTAGSAKLTKNKKTTDGPENRVTEPTAYMRCAGGENITAANNLGDSSIANIPNFATAIQTPLGKLANFKEWWRNTNPDGSITIVEVGIRVKNTRVGLHIHPYGGTTCILSGGTITDFAEGLTEAIVAPAGTCYYMPANTLMTAINLSDEDAVLMDTFTVPAGEDPPNRITICERSYFDAPVGSATETCYTNGCIGAPGPGPAPSPCPGAGCPVSNPNCCK